MYGESTPAATLDPYADPPPTAAKAASPAPAPAASGPAPRDRSRSRSPGRPAGGSKRSRSHSRSRSPYGRKRSPPPPRRPGHAPIAPNPSNVLGVFGLSIRTRETDLEEEFNRYGKVRKVTIVYDQRSDRSRGFGFISMETVEDATRCIKELNGVELNGRRIRVDYSVTDRPHAPTPGEYMGVRRSHPDDRYDRRSYRSRYDDYDRGDRDRDRDRYGRDRDGRGGKSDWRDRRSPPPSRGGGGRYSPSPPRRRRSPSPKSPRGGTNGSHSRREHDGQADASGPAPRW